MSEFMDYDDKLEIMNEFGSQVGGTVYGGTLSHDDSYDQSQDDS
jgi:hypothetical protein